ncbi:hypothetical protein FQR65_LT03974 [Abscondita terminalis]|nr:hypothetical protein FQR65_LT03974 [Abscondita terminalis]
MAERLEDFPRGPLDYYRAKASFDWKKLRVFLYTEEVLKYKQQLFKEIQEYCTFEAGESTLSLNDQRRISAKRALELLNVPSLSMKKVFANVKFNMAKHKILISFDPSAAAKHYIAFNMFPSVIQGLGTSQHAQYMADALEGKIIGAYCLTEIGHGSNAKSIQTTATYDNKSKEFIMNSPNFEAAKCWAGNLGQIATHAIVHAQLITPDGVNHSMHSFLVKLRDPKTFLPYPGILLGDMGEKISLNGIDNGYLIFNHYRIPGKNLLNKTGDVTDDGKYVTPYKDPNKRYGASLGALSVGRVIITGMCASYAISALTVAIRYAAVRKQFDPKGGELSLLEYQSEQHLLIPSLAATYVLEIFSDYLGAVQMQIILDAFAGIQHENPANLGLEIHAVSSGSKAIAGWTVRDAVQECREACAAAELFDIRNNNDANCTYEGENHILIQQTSNWLLKLWPLVLEGRPLNFPLQSVDFLTNARDILEKKFTFESVDEFMKPNNILNVYQWLVCYLLKTSFEKHDDLLKSMSPFWAKNESQVFYLKNLVIVYIQHFMIQRTHIMLLESKDPEIKKVLNNILCLYGVWALEKHIPILYKGGYATGPEPVTFMRTAILHLCKDLKNDSVSLIDAIALPDFRNKSDSEKSNERVYKHLEEVMLLRPEAMFQPSWWKQMNQWENALLKSKL